MAFEEWVWNICSREEYTRITLSFDRPHEECVVEMEIGPAVDELDRRIYRWIKSEMEPEEPLDETTTTDTEEDDRCFNKEFPSFSKRYGTKPPSSQKTTLWRTCYGGLPFTLYLYSRTEVATTLYSNQLVS